MDTLVAALVEGNPSEATTSKPAGDQFAAQLVPTEILPANEKGLHLIRATVVFTPVPRCPAPPEGELRALDDWPKWIADRFKNQELVVRMRPAMSDDIRKALPSSIAVNSFNYRYAALGGADKALDRLGAIWREWFDNMPALRYLLNEASTAAAHGIDIFQREAPGNGAGTATPDVVSVPRAELARKFIFERARNLIKMVACAQSPENAEAIRNENATPPADQASSSLPVGTERYHVIKAFLGEEWRDRSGGILNLACDLLSSPLQHAAEKAEADAGRPLNDGLERWRVLLERRALELTHGFEAATYKPFKYETQRPTGNDGQWFAKLENHLQDERRWIEMKLAVQLEDQREAARKYTEACSDCADTCSSGSVQAGDYLDKVKAQRQGHAASNIKDTAADVMDRKGQEAAAKYAAAQNASTQSDFGDKAPDGYSGPQLRWHALQGTPALMRAMHLVIDIEFEVAPQTLCSIANLAPGNGCLADTARFLEFALDGKDADSEPAIADSKRLGSSKLLTQRIWTLTKIRLPGPSEKGHCWPSTTEEWALRKYFEGLSDAEKAKHPFAEDTGFLDQFEAVADLDANLKVEEQVLRRYDIYSLDVTIAAEAEQKRQAVESQIKEVGKALPSDDKVLPADERTNATEGSTLKTGGFQIVDRWRQAAVIDEIVKSCKTQPTLDRQLDANDLAIGYRIDVGLLKAPGAREWTSLAERIVRYVRGSDPDAVDDLNEIIDTFSPPQSATGVRPVDSATMALGTRILKNSQGGVEGSGNSTAFADQLLATWDGDPIGARTGKFKAYTSSIDLPVSRRLSLPTAGDERAHRLRFGAAYSIGARAVLVGGVCASLTQAKALYESGMGRGMAYPSNVSELQRYLRQERIGPPIVAIEEALLLDEFSSERKGIDGKNMVVRSMPEEASPAEKWRFEPAETSRIVFAPHVDLDFAVMHSVFDADATKITGQPAGGLLDIDYDAEWGGFPLFDPNQPPVRGAVRGKYLRYETHDEHGNERKQKIAPSGFAAFKGRSGERSRSEEYYPDPAARNLIIALKHPEQPDQYLGGKAIRVPLYDPRSENEAPKTPGYPHCRPIRIKVKAVNSTRVPKLASYEDLERRAAEAGVKLWALEETEDGVPVMTVTLRLNPGEDFEVETWCAPTEKHLRAWFDLPEAMALIMSCAAENKAVQCCATVAAAPTAASNLTIGLRRGEASIPWSAVCGAASSVYATLMSRPLPDIASIRSFRAIHATGLPKDPPEASGLKLLRLLPATRNGWLAGSALPSDDEDGGSQVVVLGSATFDLETTETLELHAEAPLPLGGSFDNSDLGRTFDKRARGIWPRTQTGEDGQIEPSKASQRREQGPGELTYMGELFGFDVARDGKATLRRTSAPVASWKIDRQQKLPVNFTDLTLLARPDPGKDSGKDESKSPGPAHEVIFSDTLARRVTLWLAATSRTARQIPDRLTYPTQAEAVVDRKRLFREGTAIDIILPATERPGALTPKSLLPAYVWSSERNASVRRTKVRIRLRRPWWTSGEEERLGIVVWPPNLMAATGIGAQAWTNSELEQGIIERETPVAQNEGPREIDLHRFADSNEAKWREGFFTDADLGLGGAYVTRWGSDPIYASEEMAWLIDAAAFRDISASKSDFAEPIDLIKAEGGNLGALWPADQLYKPRFVENALMPIPETDEGNSDKNEGDTGKDKKGEAGKDAAEAKKTTLIPEFMMVSLVTYMPRFDPDFEHWYVDVDLDVGHARDPFVRLGLVRFQPFAKRHLQVSQPVAEWIQVVGYLRDVTISRVPGNGRDWISVDIGPTTDVNPGKDPKAQDLDTAPGETPLLRITLIESTRSAHGQILERVARLDGVEMQDEALAGRVDQDAGGLVIKTCQVNPGASRLLDLRLPIPSTGEAQGMHYAVLVEELTRTPRSTYSNEPIRKDADILEAERHIESGVRFAVRVELDSAETLPDE